jgi:hypothetical protein
MPEVFKVHCPSSAAGSTDSWQSQSQSHLTADRQSVSKSWCRAHFGTFDQIFISVPRLRSGSCYSVSVGASSRVCPL